MKLAALKPNPKNPRTISDRQRAMLAKALKKFGDLGGIIFNRRSWMLVGGHQRLEAFRADMDAKIVLTETLDKPDSTGTVARGYVETGGTRHSYREVDWPKKTETAAMIAANQHGGEFDNAGLTELLQGLGNFDMDLTGFDVDALTDLGVLTNGAQAMTPEEARKTLRERFGAPPFSVLDARQGPWQDRKRAWIALGIKSEIGRGQQAETSPGGSPRPAADYSKRQRGRGDGKPL